MRAWLVPSFAAWLTWAGCGGAPSSPPAAPSPPPAPHERAEATPHVPRPAPAQELPLPGAPLRGPRDRTIVADRDDPTMPSLPLHTIEMPLERKSDSWSPCVRAFVQGQPAGARALLGEALSLYSTSCSATRVEFRVPRVSGSAPAQPQLALIGALERTTTELALRAAYHGAPLGAERITVIADGVRWSSPRLDFDRDSGGEIATLPVTRTLAGVIRRAIEARDALLRFESATGYEDLAISDELKQELRTMLEALDARAVAAP